MMVTLGLSAIGLGLTLLVFSFTVGVTLNFIPLNELSALVVGIFQFTFCGGIPILLGGVIYWSLLGLGDWLLNRFGVEDMDQIQVRQIQTDWVKRLKPSLVE